MEACYQNHILQIIKDQLSYIHQYIYLIFFKLFLIYQFINLINQIYLKKVFINIILFYYLTLVLFE